MSQQTREIVDVKSRLANLERQLSRLPVRTGDAPSPERIKLFVALQDFTTAGDISGPGSSGQRDYTRGVCAELQFDRNAIDGSALRYMRVDGWTTVVWSPVNHSADAVATACGNQLYRCGDRFWATFDARSQRWTAISPDGAGTDTSGCDCVAYGYALWKVVEGPAWELFENRCSGCRNNGDGGTFYLFPDQKFAAIGINADQLKEPTIDPPEAMIGVDKYYVTCCGDPETPPPPPACDCCYDAAVSAEFEHTTLGTSHNIANSRVLRSRTSEEPCGFGDETTDATGYPIVAGGVQANATHLFAYFAFTATDGTYIQTTSFNVQYDIDGDPPNCGASATYNFASVFASVTYITCPNGTGGLCECAGASTGSSTSATGTLLCVDYVFPASITITPTVCESTTSTSSSSSSSSSSSTTTTDTTTTDTTSSSSSSSTTTDTTTTTTTDTTTTPTTTTTTDTTTTSVSSSSSSTTTDTTTSASSSSSTTTTTTEGSSCAGDCDWTSQSDGSGGFLWVAAGGDCTQYEQGSGVCCCVPPDVPPSGLGETANTNCRFSP